MAEVIERAAVVEAARRWLGTPYHHRASVLGVGVDCAQLVIQAFTTAGILKGFDPGHYTCDWHLHRGEERYEQAVLGLCHRVAPFEDTTIDDMPSLTLPSGEILLWRVGRTFSHSAIVTEWPYIIHSYLPSSMVEEVDVRRTPMSERIMRVYSYWGQES